MPPTRKGIYKKCLICFKEFYVKKSHSYQKFCSMNCRDKSVEWKERLSFANKGRFTGDKSYHWKKESCNYQTIHDWLRTNFIKYKCEHCGKFYEKINNLENLDWAKKTECEYERKRENFIVLCKKCHTKYDKRKNYRIFITRKEC